MPFHRLTAPAYFFSGGGTVPTGYDYLNTPSDPSVGGSGVPTPVDGIKSGGPHDGVWFVAFGEDGTASNTNRANYALAENTDALDDVVQGTIPVITWENVAGPGSPQSTIVLSGDVFTGKTGDLLLDDSDPELLNKLVKITDQEGVELETNGGPIRPILIHDGTSTNVVKTTADGFYTAPEVLLNQSIPAGQDYRVYWGRRSTVRDTATGIYNSNWFIEPLRAVSRVDYQVRAKLRELHAAPAAGQAWNGVFDSNIRSLAAAGLNERYRKATAEPAGFITGNYNTPGVGAQIVRDGQAVEIVFPVTDWQVDSNLPMPDAALAMIKFTPDTAASTSSFANGVGGDIGIYREVGDRSSDEVANEVSHNFAFGALMQEGIAHDIRASSLSAYPPAPGSYNVYTRISTLAVGATNPDSGATDTDKKTIELGAGDFFEDPSGNTAINVIDLIEVIDDGTGAVIGTFRVASILSQTRAVLGLPTGFGTTLEPDFGPAANPCRFRWIQTVFRIGGTDDARALFTTGGGNADSISLPKTITWPLVAVGRSDVAIGATNNTTQKSFAKAFAWGGWERDDTSGPISSDLHGFLYGDGSIVTDQGKQRFNQLSLTAFTNAYSSSATHTVLAGSHGHRHLRFNSNATDIVLTVVLDSEFHVEPGDELTIIIELAGGRTGDSSMVWPADFRFSAPGDAIIPNMNPESTPVVVRFDFTRFNQDGGDVWLARRVDY